MSKKFFVIGILAMLLALSPGVVTAGPVASNGSGNDPELAPKKDNLADPLTTIQLDLKQKALDAKLNGKAYGKTHEVAHGQYVELAREGEGVLWTVLGEFSDLPHNLIPQPDPLVNNRTIWVPDFNQDYYMNMLFNDAPGANSMRNFYTEQSSNRYTVNGDVTDWIPVPGDHTAYDDSPTSNVWFFLEDIST